MAKRKSLLDDVLISARNTISNFTSGAQKTISPIIKNASDMTQTFANDYNDWNKNNRIKLQEQQTKQREQSRQATSEILNRGSQAVNTVKNIAMKNVITPIAQSPIKDTYVGKFGEYAGKALALPSIETQMNKSNKEMNSQIPLLLKKANQPGISPDQKRRLLTVAGNLAKQSGNNATWLQEEYKATPLDIAKAGLGTFGTLYKPGEVAVGGLIGGGLKAGENVLTGKDVSTDLSKTAVEGANFGALLAPLAKVTGFALGPFTSKFAPVEIKNINQYINLAKNASDDVIRNKYITLTAKRIFQNLGKDALEGATAFGAFGALEPAKDLQQRIENVVKQAVMGGAFNVGMKGVGYGVSAAKEQIPALNKALGQEGFIRFFKNPPKTKTEFETRLNQHMLEQRVYYASPQYKEDLLSGRRGIGNDALKEGKKMVDEYFKNPAKFMEKYKVLPPELNVSAPGLVDDVEKALAPDAPIVPIVDDVAKVADDVLDDIPVAAPASNPLSTAVMRDLPSDLKNAKPRYGYGDKQFTLNFQSDIDKALYIVGNTKSLSSRDADYLQYLKEVFPNADDVTIRAAGKEMRDEIKDMASKSPAGELTVAPKINPETPPKIEPVATNESIQMIEDDIQAQLNKVDDIKTPAGGPVKDDVQQVSPQAEFKPSETWQEVPAGQAVPPGGEFKLDMESGKSFARWPKSIAKKNEKIIQQDKGLAGPVGPDDVITNPDDPFYNIERMNIPNEAKVIIKQEVTGDLKPKIEEMVGKTLTDKEIVDLAKVSSDDLIKAIGREDTAKFAAAQERLREKIAFLAQETAQGKPITKDFLESIIADKTFAANTARLLQKRGIDIEPNSPPSRVMVKMMKDILEVTDDLDKVLAAAKNVNWDDVASTTKFYRTFVRPTAGDWVDKLRYGSMLSSINTHIINVTSNWQGAMMLAPINKTINGIVDGLASAVTLGKHKQTQFPGEGVAFAKAAYTVGIKRAFKNMIDSLKGKTMDMNPDMRFTPLTTAGHPITSKEGALHVVEKALDVPGKALEAEDQFFIAMTKAGLENAMKYRQGKGIKMNNLTDDIERETDRILFRAPLNRTGEGLIGDAILAGGQQIQNWTYAKNPIVRWMAKMSFPFVRVGSNLAVEASQAIPGVSMINMAGKENKVEGVTKMMLGSLVTLIGASMAVSDKMKAWEPTDPKKKAAFRKAGYLPWSMELGGKSVQFTKMHPSIGVPLGMVAALDQARRDKKLDEDTAAKIMYGVAGSLKYFADQTYVKNLGDFTNLFGGDENALTQLASNYPSQFIPYRAFGGWITKIIDEYQRAPDKESPTLVKLMQTVAAGLPVASYSVPIKKTDAGVPLKNTNRLTNAISPYKIKDIDPTGAQDYQDLLTRAEQNKLIKMRSDLDSKALDAYDLRSPEEVENANRIKIKQEIEKNNIKLNNTTGGVSGGDTINVTPEKDTLSPDNVYNYWDSETQTVKTIDLNKFNEKSQGIAKYAQDNKKYTMARQIHDAQLTQEEKDKAYKTLGVTREDVRYDYLANQTTDVSVKYLLEKLTDQPHEIVLERLITGRENSISGPQFVTDEILNKLEDEGLISGDEAKALKQIKYNKSGNLIGLGVGGKGKKISLDANTTKPRAGGASFKLSGPSSSGSSKASSGIKLKQLKITPPKGATFASTYKPSVITPKLRQGTFSLKGLGKA